MSELKELATEVYELAKLNAEQLEPNEDWAPCLFAVKGKEMQVIMLAVEGGGAIAQAVRMVGERFGPFDRVALLTTAWAAVYSENYRESVAMHSIMPPSQNPDRKELITICAVDNTGEAGGSADIERHENAPPTLKGIEWWDKFDGRLTDALHTAVR